MVLDCRLKIPLWLLSYSIVLFSCNFVKWICRCFVVTLLKLLVTELTRMFVSFAHFCMLSDFTWHRSMNMACNKITLFETELLPLKMKLHLGAILVSVIFRLCTLEEFYSKMVTECESLLLISMLKLHFIIKLLMHLPCILLEFVACVLLTFLQTLSLQNVITLRRNT